MKARSPPSTSSLLINASLFHATGDHMKARRLSIALLSLPGIFAIALPNCGGSDDTAFSSGASAGTEGGPCLADSRCDVGLECRSDVCVKPGGSQGSGGKSMSAGGSGDATAGDSGSVAGGGSTGGTSGGTNPTGGSGTSEGGATPSGTGGAEDAVGTSGAGGAPIQCEGSDPLLSGQNRYCAADACYCNDPFDTCFPAATAEACCQNEPRCGDQPGDRGVDCAGQHPVVGPPRTCTSGNCFCSDGEGGDWDVCLPKAVAESCCPPGVSLTCVE